MKKIILICLLIAFVSTGCALRNINKDRVTREYLKDAEIAMKVAETMGSEVVGLPEYEASKKYYDIARREYKSSASGETLAAEIQSMSDLQDRASENSQKAWDTIITAFQKAKSASMGMGGSMKMGGSEELEKPMKMHGSSEIDASAVIQPLESEGSSEKAMAPRVDNRLEKFTEKQGDAENIVIYGNALNLFMDRKYDASFNLFKTYINTYSDNFTDNARYWMGECLYMLGDYTGAMESFSIVVEKYKMSNKIADSLFKIGMCHYVLNQHSKAIEFFEKTVGLYPLSNAAKRSKKMLKIR